MIRAMAQPAPTCAKPEFIPTRGTLLSRIKDWQDRASWQEFFNTYWKLIYNVAVKAGLSRQDAEEIVQETVLAVANRIDRFEYQPERCAFKSWLLLITRSRISDHLRRQKARLPAYQPVEGASTGTSTHERIPDPASLNWESVWNQEWAQNLADAALERVRLQTSSEQYQIFDLYVLKQWPARDVARTLRVTVMQVYLAKHRVTLLIRKEIKRLERELK